MTRFTLLICAMAFFLPAIAGETEVLTRPLPESWQYTSDTPQQLPASDQWWSGFDDAILDSLIAMGEESNFDLSAAMHRMDAAGRQMQIARASYFPTIGIDAGYTHSRAAGTDTGRWNIGASMNWEIDLFGKITAAVKQKKALYNASRAEWIGAMVSMAANIASTYVQLRVWQGELAVAEEHCVTQDSIARLVNARFECGLGAKPQVAQAMSILHSTRASVSSLQTSIHTAISSLALLTGRYPHEIEEMLSHGTGLPDYRMVVTTGIPSELLRRRPDIVQAEYRLAAAAAAVGIARKDFLPTLSLNGSVGVAAGRPGDMFTTEGFVYSISPTLSWTLFDGMARKAAAASARDEMEAQISNYNLTVMTAYNEVDNALTAYKGYVMQIEEYTRAKNAADEFLRLSLDLYTQGLSPYSDVATAQQNLLTYANSLIVAHGNAVTALIDLYKALGGGFSQYEM